MSGLRFLRNLAFIVELWITKPTVLGLPMLTLFRIVTVAFPAFIITFFSFVALDVLLANAAKDTLRLWVATIYSLSWVAYAIWLFSIAVRNFGVKGQAEAQLRVATLEKKLKGR